MLHAPGYMNDISIKEYSDTLGLSLCEINTQ